MNIPDSFGDNIALPAPGNAVFETSPGAAGIVGTPSIDLTWSATGGSNFNAWQSHAWTNAGGGATQMDGSSIGSTFSITLSPTATTAMVLNSFNFIGDTNGDTFQYQINLLNLSNSAVVFTNTTATWTTLVGSTNNGAPSILVDYTGDLGTAYRLDLLRIGGSGTDSAIDIAVDNLRIDQVPEPSTYALIALGGVAFLVMMRRMRSRVVEVCL